MTDTVLQGGFAAQANGWRWPIYELIWISGFAFVFLSILLPETLDSTILLKRAKRLRKLTGNPNLRSQSEIDQANMKKSEVIYEALVRPFLLLAEPAVFFFNLYIGLVCKLSPVVTRFVHLLTHALQTPCSTFG